MSLKSNLHPDQLRWKTREISSTYPRGKFNQDQFDNGVLSMDVEDVKVSCYDIMRMAGKMVISNPGTQTFKKRIDDRLVSGIKEDG